MQRALLAGLLASVATAVVGTWIVLRGLTDLRLSLGSPARVTS